MANSPSRRLRLGFADIANTGWTAGAHYYQNLFKAFHSLDDGRRPYLALIKPVHDTSPYDGYREQVDELLQAPPERAPVWPNFVQRQAMRARKILGSQPPPAGPAPELAAFLLQQKLDTLFACWTDYGPRFSIPWLGWIPDFQHLHLPELFSKEELAHRDWLFRQMAANATRIIVSSEDARRDFVDFSPTAASKARTLRFTCQIPSDVYTAEPGWICDHYHLPRHFVYLPDQFWRHKNHETVIEALARLKPGLPDICVVCTGNPNDNRANLYFGELLAQVARLGLRNHFIILGWVPHGHIFHLMRQAAAVLQPSRFEGWSTTVEEAKSLGKSIVLSDIAVHREQNPAQALYFDPADPAALAECLRQVLAEHAPGPDLALEAEARVDLPKRTRQFANAFLEIVEEAIA